MTKIKKSHLPSSPPSAALLSALSDGAAEAPRYRSGAVARMVRMPVATLRVWERRYGLTQASHSAGGQRVYAAADVRRLVLVKQLTDLGHAIGSLAALDMQQLQHVAATHAEAATSDALPARAWRLGVIGTALGTRLRRPALLRRIGRPLVVSGPFIDVQHAAAALDGSAVDALLIQEPQLHAGWLAAINASAPALAAVPKAVLYGFAAESVCEALATAGTALLREPQTDTVIAQWLQGLSTTATARGPRAASNASTLRNEPIAPRRWNDAALSDFAGLSSTVACECPRHVAELLMQLSQFEAYSAECGHRSAADAELHGYLTQVAAESRTRFESALEHVALHEGLVLPR